MGELWLNVVDLLRFANMAMASVVVIITFSLMAYTCTYNFRSPVARAHAFLLACVLVTYAGDVGLIRVRGIESASRWLHLQFLGVALLPAAYYLFSLAVLRSTNFNVRNHQRVILLVVALSLLSVASVFTTDHLVGEAVLAPPLSYLEAGPLFWPFVLFFAVAIALAYRNIWHAYRRCITAVSRRRMRYLLLGFAGPALGVFPYLIGLSRFGFVAPSGAGVLLLALLMNVAVVAMLVLMSYTVVYFGVLTPDRVVRYRLLRFFLRGPLVAIVVILALQTVPTIEELLGLPRDVALFTVVVSVIVCTQLLLSISKGLVDRYVYRDDRDEVAWLRELDRRLLTTTDVRQFLENNIAALCELLRTPSGFVAAVVGPNLMVEAVVGPDGTRQEIERTAGWSQALGQALRTATTCAPVHHAGYWVWPLLTPAGDNDESRLLGMLSVQARTAYPLFTTDEAAVLDKMLDRAVRALADRKLQQGVYATLRRIIPDIDRIQQLRGVVPYVSERSQGEQAAELLNPSPIHSPELEAWVKDALNHYWGGPKLTQSPLVQLQIVNDALPHAEDGPTKALRMVLGRAIERLRPDGKPNLSAPEWLLYNILEMRFVQGRRVREIANRLAMSESDLYRKQRVAIGQVARVLVEMEQDNLVERNERKPTQPTPSTPQVTPT